MIRRLFSGLLAVAAVGLFVSDSAQAGAPGAAGIKRTVSIKVFNDTEGDAIYVVGFNDKQLAKLSGIPTVQQAKKNGGTYIAAGSSKTIMVPAGNGEVAVWFAGDVPPSGPLPEPESGAIYKLNNGAKTTAGVYNVDDSLEITIPRLALMP
jgi:hypothetical protein